MDKINYNFKSIYDNIHGYINISNIACKIIDTKYFQRLRKLHQLGTCHYVFPGAIHTRFEHSLGTYYLAGKLLNCIIDRTNKELLHQFLKENTYIQSYFKKKNINDYFIDDYLCELIKISALCHDIGHGPFSHVFDDIFIKSVKKNILKKNDNEIHENRSSLILEHIIQNNNFLKNIISDNEIKFLKSLINPTKNDKSFIYQIVSNNINGLDVDKYDYIMRDTKNIGLKYSIDCSILVNGIYVIDNKICYPRQAFHNIKSVFANRYRLHKEVYTHQAVLSIQFMITDIMILLDKILNISNSINNVDDFCNLTDDYILTSIDILNNFTNLNIDPQKKKNLLECKKLLDRINNRNIYKFIGSVVLNKKKNISWNEFNSINSNIYENDIYIHNSKIGFVSGNKNNPLNNIYCYSTKQCLKKNKNNKCFKIEKEEISKLISDSHQEYIIMIYSKFSNKDYIIKEAWDDIKKKLI